MAPEAKKTKKDSRAWDALTPPLAEWILEAVATMGFERMTPVQSATIPLFMTHKDVVVEAVTGSGKTLSFLIPIVSRILKLEEPTKKNHVAAIILSPTRELASQIHSVLLSLLQFHSTSAELLPHLSGDEKRPATVSPVIVPQLLVGGTSTPAEDLSFFLRHSPNVIVSTPGRMCELLNSAHVKTPQSSFEVLVLDEADRLLDMGFKADLQQILGALPKQRRTGLFSASVSEAVGEIIRVGLRNPVKVAVRVKSLKSGGIIEDRRTPASLQMSYLVTPASQKLPALSQILERMSPRSMRSILFFSSCAAVDYFGNILGNFLPDFSLVTLHGKHEPKVRYRNFSKFLTSTEPCVLLTTDLAARGIDIPQVDLVVQVDPPSDQKVFIHRAGRAGRAGRKGLSVVFLTPGREEDYVTFLEIRKTPIAPLTHIDVNVTDTEAEEATEKIRDIVKSDRALHEKAQRAFVSFVKSYSKHTANSIFRIGDLDWTDLGRAWGLLKLPKMPELKSFQGDKKLGVDIDWDAYAYKDKTREKARKAALEAGPNPEHVEKAELMRAKRKRNAEAWSGKHEQEELRVSRREKRGKKRDAERRDKMTEEEKIKEQELDDLLAEVRRQNQEKHSKQAAVDDDGEFEGFD